MRALRWHGGQSYRLEELPDPEPGPEQVLVQVEVGAVCGSDLHLEDFGARPPVIPGHEAAGVVVACGAQISAPAPGTPVTLNPVQWCGSCYYCTRDLEHLCANTRHLGGEGVPGTWADLVCIDARNTHVVPEGVTPAAASLTEPTAVCLESFERASLAPGQSVLVLGDGPFGFLHAQIARALGADPILVAGHHDARLDRIGRATGASTCNTHTVDLDELTGDVSDGVGVDVVIEATGSGGSLNPALRALRSRGTLVVFSYIWKPEVPNMGLIHMRELNVLGSCRSHRAFDRCLELMAEGRINTELLLDLLVPLERHQEAIEAVRVRKERHFKTAFTT